MAKQYEEFQSAFPGRLQLNKDLTNLNTLRMRVEAQMYVEATTNEDIMRAVALCSKTQTPYFLLGGGTNIAFATHRIPGLTIKNNVKILLIKELAHSAYVTVSGGYPMSLLSQKTAEMGLEGLHYHIGLPGTVGGAIAMNSKWTNPLNYVGDYVYSALLLTPHGITKTVLRDYFHFAYDYSILKDTKEILLEVTFELKKGNKEEIMREAQKFKEYRHSTQPQGKWSGGCFFQNISPEEQEKHGLPTQSAGYLIDKAGLKGFTYGGFQVSPVHANFVEHIGGGTPQELKELVALIQKKVKDTFGVMLTPEVIVIE